MKFLIIAALLLVCGSTVAQSNEQPKADKKDIMIQQLYVANQALIKENQEIKDLAIKIYTELQTTTAANCPGSFTQTKGK